MKESIQLIRKSKLGDKKGNAALYELPWYMVIGNPAAGKSSAIYNSGLKFPFEETHQKMVSAGLSGTRNCDWFFRLRVFYSTPLDVIRSIAKTTLNG